MQRVGFSLRVWLVVWMLSPVVIFVVLTFQPYSLWVGRFQLTVVVNKPQDFNLDSLRFLTVRNQELADELVADPRIDGDAFFPPLETSDQSVVAEIKCTGKQGMWFPIYPNTYHYDEYLVIEYPSELAGDALPKRKWFLIPEGRGPRTISIKLP